MVRTQKIISYALAATLVRANVSSSWTSFSWSQKDGAILETHTRAMNDAGEVHEEIQKMTGKGTKVVEKVDTTSDGSAVRDQVEVTSSDGGLVRAETDAKTSIVAGQVRKQIDQVMSSEGQFQTEHVELTQDKFGSLHGKKDNVRCAGSWCNEQFSLLDSQPGVPLREHPLVATGWRVASEGPGLRGAVPTRRVHVPCHRAAHGSPPAPGGFQIHHAEAQSAPPAAGGYQMSGKMSLTVADPDAFVADPRSTDAVRAAIAQQMGVDPKYVHVTLAVGNEQVATSIETPEQLRWQRASKAAPFGAGLVSIMCLSAAFLAPAVRRRRKAAKWEQQLRAGSRLEAMYDGEWFSGTLIESQKTSEGYWVVQCDCDVEEAQQLLTVDIRPRPVAPENDLHAALLSPANKTNPVARASAFATFACGAVDEKMASQAYVHRLYQREAAVQEVRAARVYASRVVTRALAV